MSSSFVKIHNLAKQFNNKLLKLQFNMSPGKSSKIKFT